MTTAAIRERLHEYISHADDKKINALYTVLDGEIERSDNWWEDEEFVKELDRRVKAIKDGTERTYSLEEVEAKLNKLREKRTNQLHN